MESDITSQGYFNEDLQLAEPHFDEEATLLSARPVVPLKEIMVEARSRRRLVIGLAMVGSLVMGALGATLIYKQRGQQPSTAIVSGAVPGAAGIAFDEPALAEGVGGATTGALPEAGATTIDKKPVPWNSRRAATEVETKRRKPSAQQVDERELSREERFERWRLRRRSEREAWREAGGRQRKSADDLLRIREIFEGPSRP